jgi:hypothetical protein
VGFDELTTLEPEDLLASRVFSAGAEAAEKDTMGDG